MKHFASECGVCNTFGTFAIKMCGSLARNFVKKNIQRGSPFEPSGFFIYLLLTDLFNLENQNPFIFEAVKNTRQ